MSFDVRPVENVEEFEQAVLAIGQYFGMEPDEERAERFTRVLPLERMLAAHDEGRIIGGAGGFPFELSVPGGSVPCMGTTVVGVWPTHRRRGALRAMMRAHLDQAHELGNPIAALWASEETIYGRYGYGPAALAGEVTIPHERIGFAAPLERRGTVRLIDAEEAARAFPAVHESFRRERPGAFSRTQDWWTLRVLDDPPERRNGGGPKRFALVEVDGAPAAYATYRHHMSWDAGVATSKLQVIEAIGVGAQATAELWRFLLDIDWIATVATALIPPDHPLFFLLAEPRRMRYRMGDAIWVRLVDVGAALSGRSYARDDELVFEVRDAFCQWNDGAWRLAGGKGERTDAAPDLRFDVDVLGSIYLGGITLRALAQGGRVEELTPGAIDRADAMFVHGLHPWCPEIF